MSSKWRNLRGMEDEATVSSLARQAFAERLKDVRARYGVSIGQPTLGQKEFAQSLGIGGDRPQERYGLYELAKREPPLWILAALRRETGFSLDDMIAGLPPGLPRSEREGQFVHEAQKLSLLEIWGRLSPEQRIQTIMDLAKIVGQTGPATNGKPKKRR